MQCGGWGGLHSHYIVKPNRCVVLWLGFWQYNQLIVSDSALGLKLKLDGILKLTLCRTFTFCNFICQKCNKQKCFRKLHIWNDWIWRDLVKFSTKRISAKLDFSRKKTCAKVNQLRLTSLLSHRMGLNDWTLLNTSIWNHLWSLLPEWNPLTRYIT